MQERYPNLFSPVKIGNVTLKNRVAIAAMGGTNLLLPGTSSTRMSGTTTWPGRRATWD